MAATAQWRGGVEMSHAKERGELGLMTASLAYYSYEEIPTLNTDGNIFINSSLLVVSVVDVVTLWPLRFIHILLMCSR